MVIRLLKRLPTMCHDCRPGEIKGSSPVISASHATRNVPPYLGCCAAIEPTRPRTSRRPMRLVQAPRRFMVHPPCTPVTPALVRGKVKCARAVQAPESTIVADAKLARGCGPRTRRTPAKHRTLSHDRETT